jgi:hypothetical protein
MRSRFLAIFLLVLLVIPALVTACGTSSDGTTTQTTTTTTSPTSTITTSTTTTTPPEDGELAYPEVERISVEELMEMMDTMQSGVDFLIVDTRDPGSYAHSHIERACNIYYNPVGDPTELELSLVPLLGSRTVVLYCA